MTLKEKNMEKNTDNNLLKGTLILSISQITSKILGFIYLIPFVALVGTKGNVLFEYAYKPYSLILSFATLGVPLAISKFVSKYNAEGEYDTARRLFRYGLVVSLIMGIITFLVLYCSAPDIALILVNKDSHSGNTPADVTYVIRMVSTALIIVPPMAIQRGYFQGHNYMSPTAYSQLIEQVVRAAFILAASYLVLAVNHGPLKLAIGLSTFAATLGAIFSMAMLIWYQFTFPKWKEKHPELFITEAKPSTKKGFSLIRELLFTSIPFVVIGLSIPVFQFIETFTMNRSLMAIGFTQLQAETSNSLIAMTQKLILIPVGFATALGLALLPTVTKAFVEKDETSLHENFTKTFQVLLWFLAPCMILIMLLSHSVFGIMFGASNAAQGANYLFWYAPSMFLYSFYLVTAYMLQGMNREKFTVVIFIIGVLLKVILTPLFIMKFHASGTIITTNIGFLFTIVMHLWGLKKFGHYKYKEIIDQGKLIVGINIGLAILIALINLVLVPVVDALTSSFYPRQVLLVLIDGIVGGVFYAALSVRMDLISLLFGNRFGFLYRIFRFAVKKTKASS
jgi:O-antigen/teichoic acid export membrane protein